MDGDEDFELDDELSAEDVGQQSEAIQNGVEEATDARPYVVSVSIDGNSPEGVEQGVRTCTGVLVSPLLVITAAHCFNGKYWRPLGDDGFNGFFQSILGIGTFSDLSPFDLSTVRIDVQNATDTERLASFSHVLGGVRPGNGQIFTLNKDTPMDFSGKSLLTSGSGEELTESDLAVVLLNAPIRSLEEATDTIPLPGAETGEPPFPFAFPRIPFINGTCQRKWDTGLDYLV